MEQSGQHVVGQTAAAGQQPDESYIERLFPKCQPKSASASASGQQRNKQTCKRRGQTSRNKQVQQYSRKQLEARRNSSSLVAAAAAAPSSENLALNNRSRASKKALNDSSDSSDKESQIAACSGIKRSKSANVSSSQFSLQDSQSGGSKITGDDNNKSRLNNCNSQTTTRQRKGPKYTASQNLLQQLQMSSSQANQLAAAKSKLPTGAQQHDGGLNKIRTSASTSQLVVGGGQQQNTPSANRAPPQASCLQASGVAKAAGGGVIRTSRGVVFNERFDQILTDATAAAAHKTSQRDGRSDGLGGGAQLAPARPQPQLLQTTADNIESFEEPRKVEAPGGFRDDDNDANFSLLATTTAGTPPDQQPNFGPSCLTQQIDQNSANSTIRNTADDLNERESNGTEAVPTAVSGDQRTTEDKYINLFVYDNNNLLQQEEQVCRSSPRNDQQQLNATKVSRNSNHNRDISTDECISLQYQTAKQLLEADDGNDTSVIRNDTSTEELCSLREDLHLEDDRLKTRASKKADEQNANSGVQDPRQNFHASEIPNTTTPNTANNATHSNHRPAIATSLPSVDERAEESQIVEKSCGSGGGGASGDDDLENSVGPLKTLRDFDKTELVDVSDSEMQPRLNQPTASIKKAFVPPGFPRCVPRQQIVPSQPNEAAVAQFASQPSPSPPLSPSDSSADQLSSSYVTTAGSSHTVPTNNSRDKQSRFASQEVLPSRPVLIDECQIIPQQSDATQIQSVRPTSNGDDLSLSANSHQQPGGQTAGNRVNSSAAQPLRRPDYARHMPSISEAQLESELDLSAAVAVSEKSKVIAKNLSYALERISLSNESSIAGQAQDSCTSTGVSQQLQHQQDEPVQVENQFQAERRLPVEEQLAKGQTPLDFDLRGNFNSTFDNSVTNLRYHKLPNESSHYSIARPESYSTAKLAGTSSQSKPANILFNTLSDEELSGSEERNLNVARKHQLSLNNRPTQPSAIAKRSDTNGDGGARPVASSSRHVDEDPTPRARSALIFPRLDEGLSSDAASCDDEVEDEDERAMEGDVDADDDEEDDEDDEIEDDMDVVSNRGQQLMQANVDGFYRQQQQHKTRSQQGRALSPLRQQAMSGLSNLADQVDVHSSTKPSSSIAYNNYTGNEQVDTNDIKSSIPSYSGQNSQSANYWPGVSSQQQQSALSTQPPPSSNQLQFGIPSRNHQASTVGNNSCSQQAARAGNSSQISRDEVLIEGVLFNVKYLGSTHSDCEGRGEKEHRIHQAELAVHEVKFRNGEPQAAIEVQLFISTEKIMVLDDKHRKIMMDHSLRTISYIADIGDAIVLIVRKKSTSLDGMGRLASKVSCHVFESTESHTITKSISQAFQVAYTELLKANGAADPGAYLPKELDYQEVLNSQEMSTAELEMFARKDNQREVIVPKQKGEILGLSIVESGWGSILPTAVIASLKQDGPAYRCKKLSVGDQILSINGISLVGLSLAECQEILRKTRAQRVARLSVVPCPITVEVKIKRPDTKYQLGFSVQNGVICSLLRGGIAERGGVRVGHRIMSINGTTVVGVPHDKIVTLLASSVGEIRMKTCLTSLYRHMLGEEKATFL